jgi:hypothetical protein
LYYKYYSYVELIIVILIEMLTIFTLFNKICMYEKPVGTHLPTGYRYEDDLLLVNEYKAGYVYY